MYEIKLFFKSKEFIVSLAIISILTLLNIYFYFKNSGILQGEMLNGVNCYSFWNYIRVYNIGNIITFLSPIIILFTSLTMFHNKVSTSYLKEYIIRKKYSKFLTKEILLSYFRGSIIFFTISILVFIVGYIFLPNLITNFEYADALTQFYDDGISNPILYIFMYSVLTILYSIMIINLGLIVIKYIKKLNVVIVVTFVLINAINFFVGNVSIFIAKIIGTKEVLKYAYNINIYEGYFVQSTLLRAYIHTSIYVIITSFVVYLLYRNKESVVRSFE